MERESMTKSELIALTLERGNPAYRRALLEEMTRDRRLCENVVVVLRSMILFNQKPKRYEAIK